MEIEPADSSLLTFKIIVVSSSLGQVVSIRQQQKKESEKVRVGQVRTAWTHLGAG